MKPRRKDFPDETSYLLSSPANVLRLEQSIQQLKEGRGKLVDFDWLMSQSEVKPSKKRSTPLK